jgi:hypothetical protein
MSQGAAGLALLAIWAWIGLFGGMTDLAVLSARLEPCEVVPIDCQFTTLRMHGLERIVKTPGCAPPTGKCALLDGRIVTDMELSNRRDLVLGGIVFGSVVYGGMILAGLVWCCADCFSWQRLAAQEAADDDELDISMTEVVKSPESAASSTMK